MPARFIGAYWGGDNYSSCAEEAQLAPGSTGVVCPVGSVGLAVLRSSWQDRSPFLSQDSQAVFPGVSGFEGNDAQGSLGSACSSSPASDAPQSTEEKAHLPNFVDGEYKQYKDN